MSPASTTSRSVTTKWSLRSPAPAMWSLSIPPAWPRPSLRSSACTTCSNYSAGLSEIVLRGIMNDLRYHEVQLRLRWPSPRHSVRGQGDGVLLNWYTTLSGADNAMHIVLMDSKLYRGDGHSPDQTRETSPNGAGGYSSSSTRLG